MKALYVEVRKAKSGSTYPALIADLGYAKTVVTFDRKVLAELLGYSPEQFFEFVSSPVGTIVYLKVGDGK